MEESAYEKLIAKHRKEKKELIAQTQKMKHSTSKADKKKKKEIINEIAQLQNQLDCKHAEELKDFQEQFPTLEIKSLQHEFDTSAEDSKSTPHPSQSSETSENSTPSKMSEELLCSITSPLSVSTSTDASTPTKTAPRISKAQKRRNRKSEQAKEREKAILEQDIANESGNRSVEMVEIAKKLSERDLVIHEIPSDGNCLYNAIEHQLSILNLEKLSMKSLRTLAAGYLRSHKEEYLPFLENPDTGDVMSDEQFEKYCDDIADTPAWGGHVEVQVLSHIIGKPIEVIQAVGPNIIAGNEKDKLKLIVSYHRHSYGLGEHYNSVVKKTVE